MKKLSDALRERLESADESLYKIANQTGVDLGVLSRFVRRERSIRIETADTLCEYLQLELSQIGSSGRTRKKASQSKKAARKKGQ